MRDYTQGAIRILQAIDRGRVPVDWAKIDEPELVQEIAQELRKMDKDEQSSLIGLPELWKLSPDVSLIGTVLHGGRCDRRHRRKQLLKKNALNKQQLIQGRHSRSYTIQMHM